MCFPHYLSWPRPSKYKTKALSFLKILYFLFKKLGESEFSLKKGANFDFLLPSLPSSSYFYINETYSINDLYNPALFCEISQPDPNLQELEIITLDFPDGVSQESMLFLDNYVFLSFSNGSVLSYEIFLSSDNSSIDSVRFSQEIPYLFNRSNFENSTYQQNSVLLFDNFSKQILLVVFDKVQTISTIMLNSKLTILFNMSLHVNGSITQAELYENFLYLILNYTTIEIYDIRNFFQYNSLAVTEIIDPINGTLALNDIAVNDDFLLLLENSTKACYFFDRLGLTLKNTLFLNGTATIVKTFSDTVFVYYQQADGEMFLKEFLRFNENSNYFVENNIFEMKAATKDFQFLEENFLLSVHENLLTFIRHSIKYPNNITSFLKTTLAYEGVQQISVWRSMDLTTINSLNGSNGNIFDNTLMLSNLRELHFIQSIVVPPIFSCFADDSVKTQKYEMSLLLYYLNCSNGDVDPSSDIIECQDLITNFDKIRVVFDVYQELFESSNIALAIGLGIGFSLAFVITIVFCVYFYRIKHHYTTLVKEISPEENKNKMMRPLNNRGSGLDNIEEKTENLGENGNVSNIK